MRCVLFDLDGVLVDTTPMIIAALAYVAGQLGLPPHPEPERRAAAELSPRKAVRQLFPLHPSAARLLEAGVKANARQLRPCEGVETILGALPADAVAVVTSRNRAAADLYLRSSGLAESFGVVITWGDTTRHKPHPDPLLKAMAQIRRQRGSYVGDTPGDMVAAIAAGLVPIGAAWASSFTADDLLGAGAAFVAERPEDIHTYLQQEGG